MKTFRLLSLTCMVFLAGFSIVKAQTWVPLTNQPTFSPAAEFLLTDGRVIMQDNSQTDWWVLTPDINGSYVNGTWSQVASTPANYAPLFYASAVLADGRLAIIGGEYNFGDDAFTTLGAVYDPKTDTWKRLAAPKGWPTVGDAASVVLPDGAFMVASCCDFVTRGTNDAATATGNDLHWNPTGLGKADNYDEEAFTLLPSGKVLLVDVTNPKSSEIYDPNTGAWTSAGTLPVAVADPVGGEIGPAVLRPDGTVLQTGATKHNAIYDSNTGFWSAAPNFPLNGSGQQLDVYDGPASILPDGNVLVMTSPGQYQTGLQFFEWNGKKFNPAPATPNAANASSYYGRMLVLPDGGVMQTDYSTDVEIYYSSRNPNPAWAPTITGVATKFHPGEENRELSGTQLNGLSQGAAFGDDFQDATNYPLVRITNNATGHVFYCRTHDHSSMGVATGSLIVTTKFDVPADTELGASELAVVANGIPSNSVAVTIEAAK